MQAGIELPPELEEFYAEGMISAVLQEIRPGKEATAFICAAGSGLDCDLVVAKKYHHRSATTKRGFASGGPYAEGRVVGERTVRNAIRAKSEFGREAEDALWVDHEFEWLSNLHYAGADVPEPYVCNEKALLMEYIGDDEGPAQQLQAVKLDPEIAGDVADRVLWNIETMLRENCIHADLSAFNILWDGARPVIIDLPQCIDPRQNRSAQALLERDILNVARYFARYGFEMDAAAMARRLWRLWLLGEL